MHEKKVLTILKRKMIYKATVTHYVSVGSDEQMLCCYARHELSTPTLIPTNKTKKETTRSKLKISQSHISSIHFDTVYTRTKLPKENCLQCSFYHAHTTFHNALLDARYLCRSPNRQCHNSFHFRESIMIFASSFHFVCWLVFCSWVKHWCLYVTDTIKARQCIVHALGACRTLNGATNQALVACLLHRTK